ncbi:MAG TPA: ABC transporter permease [Streptosporangiaceae bacterium]|jgi:ABC-2 type transport system permease protein
MMAVIGTFSLTEWRALYRGRFPFVWFVVLPAVASAILGPALATIGRGGATGRVTIGFGIMFCFMTVNYVGRALYREFDSHTWRRTATAAPASSGYLAGKCLAVLLIGIAQLVVFVIFALTALNLPLNAGVLTGAGQLAVILVPFALTGVATGVLMFTLIRRAEVFFSITYLVLLMLGALGGALVPSPQLPHWAQVLGWFTPHHWAMRAIDETTVGTAHWSVVLEGSGLLVLFSVVLAAIALARFDFRKERYSV